MSIRYPVGGGREMEKYYKASEAIKKLGIPRSTFFVLAQTGQIPKINLPLRKHAVYPKTEIDNIAAEYARLLEDSEPEPERLRFMIPTKEDFEQIVEIDKALFPGETWMTAEELQYRLPHNPEVTHVLKDVQTNIVIGYISMSPLRQDVLERLLTLEIDETSLRPGDFTPYIPNSPLDCYIVSIGARPGSGIAQQLHAGRLALAMKDYLIGLLERGVIIRRIYTVATTKEGERLAKGLDFSLMRTPNKWQSGYEDFR